ncbi:hypothetical protein M758_4G056300 [Ceratodon purpureus]|nr:hypothetical protein M758_4G056300 [Ceratodon purpureus]
MGWLSVAQIVDLHFMTRFLLILLCSRVRLRFSQVEFLVGVGARTEHSAVASRRERGFGEQFDDATLLWAGCEKVVMMRITVRRTQ